MPLPRASSARKPARCLSAAGQSSLPNHRNSSRSRQATGCLRTMYHANTPRSRLLQLRTQPDDLISRASTAVRHTSKKKADGHPATCRSSLRTRLHPVINLADSKALGSREPSDAAPPRRRCDRCCRRPDAWFAASADGAGCDAVTATTRHVSAMIVLCVEAPKIRRSRIVQQSRHRLRLSQSQHVGLMREAIALRVEAQASGVLPEAAAMSRPGIRGSSNHFVAFIRHAN